MRKISLVDSVKSVAWMLLLCVYVWELWKLYLHLLLSRGLAGIKSGLIVYTLENSIPISLQCANSVTYTDRSFPLWYWFVSLILQFISASQPGQIEELDVFNKRTICARRSARVGRVMLKTEDAKGEIQEQKS